jgi:hypothetical protein
MPLFNVAVREHTYTGRFYSDVVQAESYEEALRVAAQHAAVLRPPTSPEPQNALEPQNAPEPQYESEAPRREEPVPLAAAPELPQAATPEPPPGPAPQYGFSVVVREQPYAGRFYSDVVQAASPEEALQVAAAQAAAAQAAGQAAAVQAGVRARCADVWVYALLHCELEAGHDPPHLALAHGYRRPVMWVRDDLGVAHAVPDPATDAPAASPVAPPPPVQEAAQEAEPPQTPFTAADS